jgi:hypothetical protein
MIFCPKIEKAFAVRITSFPLSSVASLLCA